MNEADLRKINDVINDMINTAENFLTVKGAELVIIKLLELQGSTATDAEYGAAVRKLITDYTSYLPSSRTFLFQFLKEWRWR